MFCQFISRNLRFTGLVFTTLAAWLFMSPPAQAQAIPQMGGVYGAFLTNSQIPTALASSNVDGMQVIEPWSTIEPQEGVYDWTSIDSLVAQAATYGKKISLGIQTGYLTPAWVFTDGAQAFQYVWDKDTSIAAICSVQNIPVPWDPVFLSKWQTFVAALGARYQSNATIISVIMYGASTTTIETTLPETVNEAITNGTVSCTGPNYPANWQAIGYTRTVVENAIYQMQGYFQQAFPRTQLLAALNPSGFPPIDQNGNIFSGGTDFQAPLDLLNYGMNTLGQQFSAGNGGLSNTWVWSLLAGYGATLNVGFQTTTVLGANVTAAGNLAIGANSSWIELYGNDLLDSSLQAEIASLHQALSQ
jgi:glycosyl hydrolase family 42 (putative beta-galactosidase)